MSWFSIRPTATRWDSFIIPCLLWWLIAGVVILVTDQEELHLVLNGAHSPATDFFFRWTTHLGDRRMAWFAGALLLLSRRFRWGFTVLAATISSGLMALFFKHQFFGPTPRPVTHFGEDSALRVVEGFQNRLVHSMPSGHAAIAFALFTTLAFWAPSRLGKGLCIFLALITAASRVYLSEHFLEDVYVGSFLGVACALLAWALIRPESDPVAPSQSSDELQ